MIAKCGFKEDPLSPDVLLLMVLFGLYSDERHGKPGFAAEKKPQEEEEEDLNETNYDEVYFYMQICLTSAQL